ncbi:MAG: hypothetical protein KF726_26515 [Anaerolineae bacterium]|nr:hypothetical protein [Anaerolineae bacterium]
MQTAFTPEYWSSQFKITRTDLDYLFSLFLELETPLTRQQLAERLVEFRIKKESDRLRKQLERGTIFQPKNAYEIGQEVVFPALEYASGKVVATRAGNNPDYGDFTVIDVEFEGKRRKEFASALSTPHALNIDEAGGQRGAALPMPSIKSIMDEYGESIIDEIEARLVDEEDATSFGDQWFLASLLPDVNVGHLHLAEAVLDINEGGPLPSDALLKDIDLALETPQPVREFSLNAALANDDRFDDVGAAGQVQWFLRRLEPDEVQNTPPRLLYTRIDYDPAVLTDDLRALEREIDDEWSDFETVSSVNEGRIVLNYPHRRVGTLPLTSRIRALFPTAYESPRIRVTLVDAQTGDEFAGWVVHEDRFVFGLFDFYKRYGFPIGGYLMVKRTDDPGRLLLEFQGYKPRSEYIRLAVPQNGRLTFANFKRSIGAAYDDLSIIGTEDIKGVDQVWKQTTDRRRGLVEIMKDLIPELGKLAPQNAVHAKTLYAAVNILRRMPPGPIFAALLTRDDFEHVGGPYWRVRPGGSS